jgi:hypothetical protein
LPELGGGAAVFLQVVFAIPSNRWLWVSRMPNTNPLNQVLTALCYRVGATVAAGAIAISISRMLYTFFTDARPLTSTRELGRGTWSEEVERGSLCRRYGMSKLLERPMRSAEQPANTECNQE